MSSPCVRYSEPSIDEHTAKDHVERVFQVGYNDKQKLVWKSYSLSLLSLNESKAPGFQFFNLALMNTWPGTTLAGCSKWVISTCLVRDWHNTLYTIYSIYILWMLWNVGHFYELWNKEHTAKGRYSRWVLAARKSLWGWEFTILHLYHKSGILLLKFQASEVSSPAEF